MNVVCDSPRACEVGPGQCVKGQCVYRKKSAGTVCRAQRGLCDEEEYW